MTIDYGDRSEKARKRYLSNGHLLRLRIVVISIVLMMAASFLWMISKQETTERDLITDDIDIDVDVDVNESSQRFYHFEMLNQLATDIALHTRREELLVVSYTQQGKKERGATGTPGWGNAVLNFAAVNGMVYSIATSSYHLIIPFHTPFDTSSHTIDATSHILLTSTNIPPALLFLNAGLEFASTCLSCSCSHFHVV